MDEKNISPLCEYLRRETRPGEMKTKIIIFLKIQLKLFVRYKKRAGLLKDKNRNEKVYGVCTEVGGILKICKDSRKIKLKPR